MAKGTTKVYQKYMVVLPKAVREQLRIQIGDRLGVEAKAGKVEMVPLRRARPEAVQESYGMFRLPAGTDIHQAREKGIVFLAKE